MVLRPCPRWVVSENTRLYPRRGHYFLDIHKSGVIPQWGQDGSKRYLGVLLMPAGFEVRNEGNQLQIDGRHSNLQLVNKWQVTTTTSVPGTSSGMYYTTFTMPAGYESPVVAVRPTVDDVLVCVDTLTNGTVEVYSNSNWVPIEVYVFALAYPTPTTNYGLEVYNPDTGKLVFSSSAQSMRVVDVLNITRSEAMGLWRNYPDRKTAVMFTQRSAAGEGQYAGAQPNLFFIFTARSAGMKWNGSVIQGGEIVTLVYVENYTGGTGTVWPNYSNGRSGIMVIDVTGY